MFEYDSSQRRPWWFYLVGLLYIVLTFAWIDFLQTSRDRHGELSCLIPGTILFLAVAIYNRIVSAKRKRFIEADGLVLEVASQFPTEVESKGAFFSRDVKIRFPLPGGDPYTVELSGFYRYEVGDTVPMLYDPKAPSEALPSEHAIGSSTRGRAVSDAWESSSSCSHA